VTHEFLAMGGYAAFVWPAYAVTLGGLALMIGLSVRELRSAERRLAKTESRATRRRSSAGTGR
jgi:heme exporter protein D